MPKTTSEKESPVGKVSHLYRKIGVAIVKLSGSVSIGDTLRFKGGERAVEEKISSMQIEHKDVSSAKKGDEVGVKISGHVCEGDTVYKE